MKLKFNYYSRWVGGWSDKTKLILISILVEVVVEVELGNIRLQMTDKALLMTASLLQHTILFFWKINIKRYKNIW